MGTIVGGATLGNWSAGGSWVGGVAPTAADDVTLTAASIGTLVIDGTSGAPNLCRSLDCTGFVGTITHATTKQLNVGDGTTGKFLLVAGMTYAPSSTSLIKFVSTSGGVCQITTAAKRMGPCTFDGVGGSWQFQDAFNPVSGATQTLTNGTLDTNSQTVGSSSGTNFSSNNSNTRALTLGSTNWKFGNTGSILDIGTATGMTLSAGTSTFDASLLTTSAATFTGGGLTYNILTSVNISTGTGLTITGANTFATLTLSSSSGTKATTGYSLSANQTVTGTFLFNGNSATSRNFISSNTMGTPRTITAATVSASSTQTDFRDITGAGAGSWNLASITGGSGDCGGNSGITFNTQKNCYMNTAVSVNWSGSNWFTTSGGSTPISPAMPLPQDTAYFDVNSVTAGSKTITNSDQPRLPAMDWSNVANTPAFASGSNAWELYGSMKLVSGMTHTGTGPMTYVARTSSTLNSGTLTWPTSSTIISNSVSGTLTLAANLTSNAAVTTTTGTIALGGFNISMTNLNSNGGTLSGTGIITTTVSWNTQGGTVTLGGSPVLTGASVSISSGTLNLVTYNFTGASSYTFTGGTVGHSADVVFDTMTLHYTGGGGSAGVIYTGIGLEGL